MANERDRPHPTAADAGMRTAAACRRLVVAFATLAVAVAFAAPNGPDASAEDAVAGSYGIAMHGAPALSRSDPLPYVDPAAPQGGRITFGVLGTFDTLNPMIPRGTNSPGLRDALYGNLVYESLAERNRDEAFALYGFLASSIEVSDARDKVTFVIDESAAFSDGEPVTAADVVFSLELLREQGWPYARNYYSKVEDIEMPDERTVTLSFPNANDRELPLILGLMPILPEHDTDAESFGRTTLDPPAGTGPYVIAEVDPGRSLLLRRNENYWGNDHPLNAGRYNAEEVRFVFYRDETTLFEAFKAGEVDVFLENDPNRWVSGYDFPAVNDGTIVRTAIDTGTPRGMFAFVFNTRRPPFDKKEVREAINLLFDFEWINANMFHGLRTRTDSYFTNSELAATGRPASAGERALLADYSGAVLDSVMDGTWTPSMSDGSGRDRTNLRAALSLLREVGFSLKDGRVVDEAGKPLTFEILVSLRDDERLALAFQRLLRPLGIVADVRYVDSQQYNARMLEFDFDMARVYWPTSLSPGNEQRHRWSAGAADVDGSFNWAGAKEPAVDAMIDAILAARDRDDFVDAVRALDRVLLSGTYVVPLYHTPEQWIAHTNRLGRPDAQSLSGVEFETWWVKP